MTYHDPRGEYKTDSLQTKPLFGVRQIGTTKWVDQSQPDPVKAIQAEIWSGAGSIEICAPGTGRGSPQQPTFEQFDINQKQAIRELIKVSDVDVTTHASPAFTLSGLGQRGFDRNQQQKNKEEAMKAIDFAAEAVNGGSVVVHTGEFPRSIGSNAPGAGGFNKEGDKWKFEEYGLQDKEAQYYLVDKKSGEMIKSVQENQVIFTPTPKRDDKGNIKYLESYNGEFAYDDVLKIDLMDQHKAKYGEDWDKYPDEIKNDARIQLYETDVEGNIQTDRVEFHEYRQDKFKEIKEAHPEYSDEQTFKGVLKQFFKEQMYEQVQSALGSGRQYEDHYHRGLSQWNDANKELKKFEEIEKNVSKEEWENYKIQNRETGEYEDPIKHFKYIADQAQRTFLFGRESSSSGRRQARELLRQIRESDTIEEVGLARTTESAAELGMYALERTKTARKERPSDDIKDIMITLENIYPTMGGQDYGSHPDEIINIVQKSRDAMAERLVSEKHMSKEKAKETAAKHLGMTLDTGHMNMWKKHFVKDKGESQEKYDERYKDWYVTHVQKMADAGVIGNVHLADNFGYDDVHLAPGLGNAPVQDVLKILNKSKYDKKIQAEGGFSAGHHKGIHEVWKAAGVSIYNSNRGTDPWTTPGSRFYSMHDNYLNSGNKPNFIFKGYAPESEDWRPWSGTGME